MTDEEIREFAREQAQAIGLPEMAPGICAAFFYVRARARIETAKYCVTVADDAAMNGYEIGDVVERIEARFALGTARRHEPAKEET